MAVCTGMNSIMALAATLPIRSKVSRLHRSRALPRDPGAAASLGAVATWLIQPQIHGVKACQLAVTCLPIPAPCYQRVKSIAEALWKKLLQPSWSRFRHLHHQAKPKAISKTSLALMAYWRSRLGVLLPAGKLHRGSRRFSPASPLDRGAAVCLRTTMDFWVPPRMLARISAAPACPQVCGLAAMPVRHRRVAPRGQASQRAVVRTAVNRRQPLKMRSAA